MHLLWIMIAFSATQERAPVAFYGDEFADRYSSISAEASTIPDIMPLEEEVIVYSPTGEGVARTIRTDGAKVAYEDNIAIVSVEHGFGDPVFLRSRGFRTIAVSWIGERYVYINKGIGHVVSIEEIFDLVESRWLVQHTVHYRWP